MEERVVEFTRKRVKEMGNIVNNRILDVSVVLPNNLQTNMAIGLSLHPVAYYRFVHSITSPE